MVVLDTDLLIAYMRGKFNADLIVKWLKSDQLNLMTTSFNIAELYKGCYAMDNVAKGLRKVQNFIGKLDGILGFDEKSIQEYAKISADLKKRGNLIGTMDELIASICIANNERFLTRNIKHFEKIEDLTIINWFNLGQKLNVEK